jgi:hypothetical protein
MIWTMVLFVAALCIGAGFGWSASRQKYGYLLWKLRDEAWDDAHREGASPYATIDRLDTEARKTRVVG